MQVDFKVDGTMIIVPESSVELMALKYWMYEFQKHGVKMLEVMVETHMEVIPEVSR